MGNEPACFDSSTSSPRQTVSTGLRRRSIVSNPPANRGASFTRTSFRKRAGITCGTPPTYQTAIPRYFVMSRRTARLGRRITRRQHSLLHENRNFLMVAIRRHHACWSKKIDICCTIPPEIYQTITSAATARSTATGLEFINTSALPSFRGGSSSINVSRDDPVG